MRIRIFIRGLFGLMGIRFKKKRNDLIYNANYYYKVFFRHLIHLHESGMKSTPKKIAEIGPGYSLGVGLAALLCGSDEYYAFDIIHHINDEENIKTLQEMVDLFKKKTPIPDNTEFPKVWPPLKSYEFPTNLIRDNQLDVSFLMRRAEKIKKALLTGECEEIKIKYVVPWNKMNIENDTLDLIYSQAVMEHIDNLDVAYNTMYNWLKDGGYISHVIDYSAHETHKKWNGHRFFPTLIWGIILKGRSFSINRVPHSFHKNEITKNGFSIINEINDFDYTGKRRKKYSNIEDDLIRGTLIQARK